MEPITAADLPASAEYLRAAVPSGSGWRLAAGFALLVADGADTELLVEGEVTPLEYARMLAAAVTAGSAVTKVNLPANLAAALALPEPHEWHWLRRDRPFPVVALPADCRVVPPGAVDAEIERFFQTNQISAQVLPGNPEIRFWALGRDAAGEICAAAAGTEWASGERVVNSVGVRPDCRRQGWGGAVTLLAAGQHFSEGAPGVSLGVRGGNLPALSLYRRIGFERQWDFVAARLAPRRDTA